MQVREMISRYYPAFSNIEHYPASRTIVVNKVQAEWGILGNFAASPIVLDGVCFPSAEHLFQILKLNDTPLRRRVLAAPRNLTMKHMAISKDNSDCIRPDWPMHIVDALSYTLQQKFNQCPAFQTELLRTKGFYIVEKAHKRTFDSYSAILVNDEWVGPNLMGRLLMTLREEGQLQYTLPHDMLDFSDIA